MLADVVESFVRSSAVKRQLALPRLIAGWESVTGEVVAAHTRPTALVDGVLNVSTDSQTWATQMKLLSQVLIDKINERFGPNTVNTIIVLGPGNAKKR